MTEEKLRKLKGNEEPQYLKDLALKDAKKDIKESEGSWIEDSIKYGFDEGPMLPH